MLVKPFVVLMVPKAGLEPARVSPLPPQDSVSTKFHHFGPRNCYLAALSVCTGAAEGAAAGEGVALLSGVDGATGCSMGGFWFDMIDSPPRRVDMYASPKDVNIKTMAATVVALPKKVEAPLLPKSVWLDPPPKAAPISAPLPVCNSTIRIRAIQTITCMITKKTDIL